jgi:hypothetical protein
MGALVYSGTLQSTNPFVVRDSAGADITAASVDVGQVRFIHLGTANDIMIGRKIEYDSERESGGIYHISQITFVNTPGRID